MAVDPGIQSLLDIGQTEKPIIMAGVGSGLTAKGAVLGGADLLAVYNTAVYRIKGLPTALAFLPYDDANQLTLTAAPEIIANAGNVPVLLGFGAHDPRMPGSIIPNPCNIPLIILLYTAIWVLPVLNEFQSRSLSPRS